MATGTRSLGIQQSAIDFLGGGQFGCTRTPVETTRRSIVERKQRRCVRSAVNPAAVGRLHPTALLNRCKAVDFTV
jgi:hypothetical protein